jgi:serine/threonine protein kinase/WD40 repeat protein
MNDSSIDCCGLSDKELIRRTEVPSFSVDDIDLWDATAICDRCRRRVAGLIGSNRDVLAPVAGTDALPSAGGGLASTIASTIASGASDSAVTGSGGLAGANGFALAGDFQQRFDQCEMLGRGGFGVVYRAYDRKLRRYVALKVARQTGGDGLRARKSLQREAEATARLRHPHLVALHDIVFTESDALLVSELIIGQTLSDYSAQYPDGCPPRVAATIIRQVAQAVQHAHDQNVLHRDIKPSNILLDSTIAIDGLPFSARLADFGVARIIHDDTVTESHTGFVGTYCYTPPEAILNAYQAHTRASDIYSLGVVLYELIVGRKPFDGGTLADMFRRISAAEFADPSTVCPTIPPDLEAICLCCMSRRPGNRYTSAANLASDLGRFLNDEPVEARLPGRIEHLVRWVNRYPTRTAILAVSAIALAVFFLLLAESNKKLTGLNRRLVNVNEKLSEALQASRQALLFNEQSTYAGDIQKVFIAIDQHRLRDARTLLDRYDPAQPLGNHRDLEWDHAKSLITRDSRVLWQGSEPIYCISQVADQIALAGADGWLRLVDRESGGLAWQNETGQGEINSILFDPDRDRLWCSGDDGSIHIYDLKGRNLLRRIQAFEEGRAYELVLCTEVNRIVCLGSEGDLAIIDAETFAPIRDWSLEDRSATTIANAGAGRIAVGHKTGLLQRVDVSTGEILGQRIEQADSHVSSIFFDKERDRLLLAINNSLRFLDLQTFSPLQSCATPDAPIGILYDPVSDLFVVAMTGGVFHRYRATAEGTLVFHDGWVTDGSRIFSISIEKDTGQILSVDSSGAVRAWNESRATERELVSPSQKAMRFVDFRPMYDESGGPVLAISDSTEVVIHDLSGESPIESIGFERDIRTIRWLTPRQIFVTNGPGPGAVVDLQSDERRQTRFDGQFAVVLSEDERWILGSETLANLFWLEDLHGISPPRQLSAENPGGALLSTRHGRVFWNDGNRLMSQAIVGDAAAMLHCVFPRVPHFLALNPGGELLAIGLSDREVHLWDWKENRRFGPILMHPETIRAVTFSPGGGTLLTVGGDGSLSFWNVTTGELMLRKSIAKQGDVRLARFSADARHLAVCDSFGGVRWLSLF